MEYVNQIQQDNLELMKVGVRAVHIIVTSIVSTNSAITSGIVLLKLNIILRQPHYFLIQ